MKEADIYITIGKEVLKAVGGYRKLAKSFLTCNGDQAIFWWRAANKPTREVRDVYIVIGNKVRWRTKIAGIEPGGDKTFDDGRTIFAKNWMLLFDFEQLPYPQEERRGSQGFRYKEIS